MTTKVIILCPDNSIHDILVQVVKDEVVVEEALVPQHEQSDPIYLDSHTRLLVSEVPRRADTKENLTPGAK